MKSGTKVIFNFFCLKMELRRTFLLQFPCQNPRTFAGILANILKGDNSKINSF